MMCAFCAVLAEGVVMGKVVFDIKAFQQLLRT